MEESIESGFELREAFKKKQKKLERQMLGEDDSDEEEKKDEKEDGINWGFAEDAWDDSKDDDDNIPDPTKKPNFLKVLCFLSVRTPSIRTTWGKYGQNLRFFILVGPSIRTI